MEDIMDELNLSNEEKWVALKYLRGYKLSGDILASSENLLKFQEIVANLSLPLTQLPIYDINRVVMEGQAFLSNHFRFHDVRAISDEEFKDLEDFAFDTSEEMLTKLNSFSFINPFQLPIYLENTDFMYGATYEIYLLLKNVEYLRKAPILFKGIFLSNCITPHSIAAYVHELTHTQLNSQKGSVSYFVNSEVLSICLELLSLKDTAYNDFNLNIRLKSLQGSISALCQNTIDPNFFTENIEKATVYVSSTLKAYQLYAIYSNGNYAIKKEILKYIQQIFDNEICLEEFLDKYEVTADNGLKLIFNQVV